MYVKWYLPPTAERSMEKVREVREDPKKDDTKTREQTTLYCT
jgi:hypothetical protein